MKPYLLAPIAIAGMITTAGTATIASAEMKLFRSGKEIVASLSPNYRAGQSSTFEFSTARDEVASNWTSDFKLQEINDQLAGLPAPETTVDAQVIDENDEKACEKKEEACEQAEMACEKARAQADAAKTRAVERRAQVALARVARRSATPKVALTSTHSIEATPETAANVAVVMNADNGDQFVHLTSGKGEFKMMFDTKKFADKHKMFAKDFEKMRVREWKSLSDEDLKKLRTMGITIDANGKGEIPSLTINPVQIAAGVQSISFEAVNDSEQDEDGIETSSK